MIEKHAWLPLCHRCPCDGAHILAHPGSLMFGFVLIGLIIKRPPCLGRARSFCFSICSGNPSQRACSLRARPNALGAILRELQLRAVGGEYTVWGACFVHSRALGRSHLAHFGISQDSLAVELPPLRNTSVYEDLAPVRRVGTEGLSTTTGSHFGRDRTLGMIFISGSTEAFSFALKVSRESKDPFTQSIALVSPRFSLASRSTGSPRRFWRFVQGVLPGCMRFLYVLHLKGGKGGEVD